MSDVSVLLARHEEFLADGFVPDLPLAPALRALVVTCVDPRVEPAAVLGLRLGDAAVLRTVGGRITPSTLVQLRLLGGLGAGPAGVTADLVVMHHTGCGITRMAARPEVLAPYFEVPAADLRVEEIVDPRAALRADLRTLAGHPEITAVFRPVGLLYDLSTGSIERIEPEGAGR